MSQSSLFSAVVLLNLFAYLTIRLRPFFFKTKLFKPMIWNFKLSLLPMVIMLSTVLIYIALMYTSTVFKTPFFVYIAYGAGLLGMLMWLLMLPNSGYLITELNLTHRNMDTVEVPIWYDIVSVLSFALSGIVNTLGNIALLQLLFLIGVDPDVISKSDYNTFLITAVLLNFLVAVGVYLGREIRFNSWDILHPKSFINKLTKHFNSSKVFKECILFIVMHTTFFMIMYYALGIPMIFVQR